LAAAQDDDYQNGEALIRCSSDQTVSQDITVTEIDDEPDPAYLIPFSETFDGAGMASNRTVLSGQHGWVSGAGSLVQTGIVHGGTQALQIQSDTAAHTFSNGSNRVAFSWWIKPVAGIAPESVPADAAAVIWVFTNGNVTVYSNSTEVTLPVQVSSNVWNFFEVEVNYVSNVWKLSVNGTNAAENLALYSAQSAFAEFRLASQASPTWFDDLNISNVVAAAQNTALDDWLATHYGTTNVDVNVTASNGVNTILEAYIAGLDPTNPASVLLISDLRSLTSGSTLQWQGVSGRVYNVYWSSNLLSGFQPLETNVPWTGNSFTDTVHGTANEGFYKIEVRIEP
jgi:hypothetical protein